MNVKIIQLIISILALIFLLLHLIKPDITIDAISISLIVIAILPWLSSLLKSIELPGGLKIEYKELE
jgi:hypothetical protein